jgi:signal transduction histidine kinase
MLGMRTSIHRKFMVVVLATAAIALLIAGAAMVIHDLRSYREVMVADLQAQAGIVGQASAPALEFEDPAAAQGYLDALKGKSTIVAAAIYTARGARFASYSTPGQPPAAFPDIPGQDGHAIEGNQAELFQRIVSNGQILGTVYLRAQLDLAGRLLGIVGIVGAVMVASLAVAYLLSRRMHRFVTGPLLEVAAVARKVMDRRDFSSRARRTTDDEIGVLVDSFNGMLAEIEHVIGERARAEGALRDSEERLLALNTELEQRVQSRTEQLETANKDLEGFSYSVSHDLRAPIRAVGGFATLLAEDHGAELSDEARRKIGIIRAEAARMGQLIDDLLAFSRLGRKALDPVELDMGEMARAVYERLNHADPGRPVEFRLGSMPAARGDRGLFEQVWMNLLSNAIKFSSKTERPLIEVGGIAEQRELIFFVRDNGAGFDPKYASKLFGVFQRLHRQEDYAGTGVGLALVHRIVSRHGGRVWADGRPGAGATFHFSLPKEPFDG